MKRELVESSVIASIGYDEVNKILEIEFKRGTIYRYSNVPIKIYNEFKSSSSHGSYFNGKIRNEYKNSKI